MIMSYESNAIYFHGKRIEILPLPARICKVVIPTEKIAVILLGMSHMDKEKYDKCRNVFAVNDKGEVVWQIEKSPYEHPGPYGSGETIPNPFTGMIVDENGQLKVGDGGGWSFDVDIETGKLSNPRFTK